MTYAFPARLAAKEAVTAEPARWRRRMVLVAMCLATFMIQLDVTIVNVALPTLQRELGLGPAGLEWVVSGYALSLAAFIPLAGALGDRFRYLRRSRSDVMEALRLMEALGDGVGASRDPSLMPIRISSRTCIFEVSV